MRCCPAGQENPALKQGNSTPEQKRSAPGITRRDFLLGLTIGVAGAAAVTAVDTIRDESEPWRLTVVSVQPPDKKGHYAEKVLDGHTKEVLSALGDASLKAICISQENVDVVYVDMDPEGVDEGNFLPFYTREQLGNVVESVRHGDNQHVVAVLVNTDPGGPRLWSPVAGLALPDKRVVFVNSQGLGALAHELGHLHWENDRGLGHQGLLTTSSVDKYENLEQAFARSPMDTIQNLIKEGRIDFAKKEPAVPDPYASKVSIMGSLSYNLGTYDESTEFTGEPSPNKGLRTENKKMPALLLSAIETARIADVPLLNKVEYDKKLVLTHGTDGLFGVSLDVPDDHILRQLVPDADQLFFGLSMSNSPQRFEAGSSFYDEQGYQVKIFISRKDTPDTIHLDVNPNDLRDEGEILIYADEQMDIVALAGRGPDGEYVRFLPLLGDEGRTGRSILERAKR